MRKVKALVAAVALAGFGAAYAQDDAVVVRRSNPAGTILRDTVTGGLLGSAVSGGIILYNMGIQGRDNYDWGRTLAWGAGIGLAAGLIWGVVDVTTGPSYAMTHPVRDGQSMSLDVRRTDQSNRTVFPLMVKRF
jgi:hypothetical protein